MLRVSGLRKGSPRLTKAWHLTIHTTIHCDSHRFCHCCYGMESVMIWLDLYCHGRDTRTIRYNLRTSTDSHERHEVIRQTIAVSA